MKQLITGAILFCLVNTAHAFDSFSRFLDSTTYVQSRVLGVSNVVAVAQSKDRTKIYVATKSTNPIQIYDNNLTWIGQSGPTARGINITDVDDIAVDPNDASGTVYILVSSLNKITALGSDGSDSTSYSPITISANCKALAARGGYFYRSCDSTVYPYPSTITKTNLLGGFSAGANQAGSSSQTDLLQVKKIISDPDGNILVTDSGQNRVVKYNSSLSFISVLGLSTTSTDGCSIGVSRYCGASDTMDTGNYLTRGSFGAGGATAIISSDDSVYVSDTSYKRIQRFNKASGDIKGVVGEDSGASRQLFNVVGLTFNGQGNIVVLEGYSPAMLRILKPHF